MRRPAAVRESSGALASRLPPVDSRARRTGRLLLGPVAGAGAFVGPTPARHEVCFDSCRPLEWSRPTRVAGRASERATEQASGRPSERTNKFIAPANDRIKLLRSGATISGPRATFVSSEGRPEGRARRALSLSLSFEKSLASRPPASRGCCEPRVARRAGRAPDTHMGRKWQLRPTTPADNSDGQLRPAARGRVLSLYS